MRIAFITYEFPPEIAKGGIATYVEQASRILHDRGHDVEVFCATFKQSVSENQHGILVHRCLVSDIAEFRLACLHAFEKRHNDNKFDIVECPEIHAHGMLIKKKFPELPMVVKLHMASFIQNRLLNYYTPATAKLRYFLGGIRRGRINFLGGYDFKHDEEYEFTNLADGIIAPSEAQKKIIVDEWKIPAERIDVIPNPYVPSSFLLEIPVNTLVKKVVTFIGKLNAHKGIVNLVKIIPDVVRKHPDVVFRLIGADANFAAKKMFMSEYIRQQLRGYEKNYVIYGGLDYEDVQKQLQETTLCIFPSLWECFGLVCLEAMSAGRPVIGSSEGGMKDILDGDAGILVDPHDTKEMEKQVLHLLDNEKLRWKYGQAGRTKVLSLYNAEKVGHAMENFFLKTMMKSKKASLVE